MDNSKHNCGKSELEYKYKPAIRLGPRAARAFFSDVFNRVAKDRKNFPDVGTGHKKRRSIEGKDMRHRIYFSDADFRLVKEKWELRLEPGVHNRLMIKQGNGASPDNPTLDRLELVYEMTVPQLGFLGDIEENSDQEAPASLIDLFGDVNVKLYPVVRTQSIRNKLSYYKPVEYGGRKFFIIFEFAQDEGEATPLGGKPYRIDQLELEVKAVLDMKTGIDILKHPGRSTLDSQKIRDHIVIPAMREEDRILCRKFKLGHVLESKPKEGFKQAEKTMRTKSGMKKAKADREKYLNAPVLGFMSD